MPNAVKHIQTNQVPTVVNDALSNPVPIRIEIISEGNGLWTVIAHYN